MPINIPGYADAVLGITALSNLLIVSPQAEVGYQPQNPPNDDGTPSLNIAPPTFLFQYEGDQTVLLESDITDHYIEDNTSLEDNIALKPEIVTSHGFIGELNDIPPPELKILKSIVDKLTVISPYTPQLSTTALEAYALAAQAYQVATNAKNAAISAASSLVNAITGNDGQPVVSESGIQPATVQNKQQTAFGQFYGWWRSRTLFTVQTPWAVFLNMAILRVMPVQDATTRVITDFEVTFKMIRTAQTLSLDNSPPKALSGQAATQAAPLQDNGVATPNPSTGLGAAQAAMGAPS